jgi:hypothetical protein
MQTQILREICQHLSGGFKSEVQHCCDIQNDTVLRELGFGQTEIAELHRGGGG